MMYEQIVRRQEQLIALRDAKGAKGSKSAKSEVAKFERPLKLVRTVRPETETEKWSPVPERTRMENSIVATAAEKRRSSGVKKIPGTMTLGIHGCPVSVTTRLGVLAAEMSIAQGRKVSKSDVAIAVLQKALFPQ
jgi:hypothetical protein